MFSFFREVMRQHYLVILLAIFSVLFWPQIKQNYHQYIVGEIGDTGEKNDSVEKTVEKTASNVPKVQLFTIEKLSEYNGDKDSPGLYLAIMGSVYDVQNGAKHYGVGGSYHFFAGRDASVAFISGDFENVTDTLDDVLSLEPRDILSLKQWKEFYDKDYTFKGYLIGRFYDQRGQHTEYYRKVQEQIDVAIENKRKEELRHYDFPPCNIEWNADTGTKVWCTNQSGGINRQWIGVPRKYFEPGNVGYRCACIEEGKLENANLKEYDGCDPNSTTCFYEPEN